MISYTEINKNFLIRVEDTKTYYRVKEQGHHGRFFVNQKYEYSHSIQEETFKVIFLFDEDNQPLGFLEEEIIKLKKETSLHSARTYVLLLGKELANKHFSEALKCLEDKYTQKLRRGIKINFIAK